MTAEQVLEGVLRQQVALGLVLELVLPVEPDRAGRVALLVEFGVHVDLHQPVGWVVTLELVEALLHPVGRYEHVFGVSVVSHCTLNH